MSDTNSASGSKFSIVRTISSFLKLGDDGKLDSFFTRVVKTLNKEISAFKKNLDNLKFNHEQRLDELNDSLEDAQTTLSEAYLKVDVEQIANNASQTTFLETYLENIDNHELKVQSIEKQIESEKESYNAKKETIEKSIASLTKRITKISEE